MIVVLALAASLPAVALTPAPIEPNGIGCYNDRITPAQTVDGQPGVQPLDRMRRGKDIPGVLRSWDACPVQVQSDFFVTPDMQRQVRESLESRKPKSDQGTK